MKFDTNGLDAIDQEIIRKLIIARDQIGKPRIGDYVRFPTGQLERFSHDWGDGLRMMDFLAKIFVLMKSTP